MLAENSSHEIIAHHHDKQPSNLKSSLIAMMRTLLVISIIMLCIYVIYFIVPYCLGWFKPFTKGGSCIACNDALLESESDFYDPTWRNTCSCNCWDGRAKGPYPRGNFKYIYYQVEGTTLWLVFVSILMVISFYQSLNNLIQLIWSGNCNYSLIPIYILGWFGVYYGYGAHFNYFNDDFHSLSWHQFYFTISECVMLFTTCMLLDKQWNRVVFNNNISEIVQQDGSLMQCKVKAMNYLLWIVLSFSLTHIVQVIHDQGLDHLGRLLFLRDVALVFSDVPYVLMCIYYLRIFKIFKKPVEMSKDYHDFVRIMKRNLLYVAISVVVMVFLLSTVTFGG